MFILEACAPAHLDRPGKGGPPVRELLFDAQTVRGELEGLDFELCQESRPPPHRQEGRGGVAIKGQ